MHRYAKNEIQDLPPSRKRQAVNRAAKYAVVATFTAATALVAVKGWEHVLEDVERLKAERGQSTIQLQSSPFEPSAPGE